MFKKKIILKNGKYVQFHFNLPIAYQQRNCFFLGFPIGDLDNLITTSNSIKQTLNQITGAYLYINIDKVAIATDIVAGIRVYYLEHNGNITYSDDYMYLLNLINTPKIKICKYELEYWRKHSYTTGASTFLKPIKKLPPNTIHNITEHGVEALSYLYDCQMDNVSNSQDKIYNDIVKNLHFLKMKHKKFILLFSGGEDSLLLANIMRSLKCDFDLVFFRAKPAYVENEQDYYRAKYWANRMGCKLIIIDANLNHVKISDVMRHMLFDKHFSLLHFVGVAELSKLYSKDTIIICGQGSDNVFTFGPSDLSLKSLLKRFSIYYYKIYFINIISALLVSLRLKTLYAVPKNSTQHLLAFLDEIKYFTYIEKRKSADYYAYLKCQINKILSNNSSHHNILKTLMRLKIFGYIQGADNQIVIQSCKQFGFYNIYLPFVSPVVIYHATDLNKTKTLLKGKYIVRDFLQEKFSIKQKKIFGAGKSCKYKQLYKINAIEKHVDSCIGDKFFDQRQFLNMVK